MNSSEIKLKMFREIDSLDDSKLEEFYSRFLKIFRTETKETDWDNLPESHKIGILEAIEQIENGNHLPHSEVMGQLFEKYGNI